MKSMSLNAKIWAIIGLLSMSAVFISYFGITGMQHLNEGKKSLLDREVKADTLTFIMTDHQRIGSIAVRDMIIARTDEEMDRFFKQVMESRKGVYENLKLFREIASPEGKRLADEYKILADKAFEYDDETIKFARENKDDEVLVSLGKAAANRKERQVILDKINDETAKEVDRAIKEGEEAFAAKRNLMLTISLLSILASCLIAYFILRALSKAIDEVISTLGDNSSQVAAAANQIASASQELSQATTEQASSVQQTSSSLAEINSMVQQTSDNAQKSNTYSNSSQKAANRGREVVEEMMRAISAINDSNDVIRNQIDESNKQISDIVKVIAEIENKTKVINDIVFQTKLLSFNASVEAARAGSEGQGFAVVAEEVGNLATISGSAAKEISDLLESSIKRVEGIVADTKTKVERLITDGKEKINHGTKVARDCKDVLEDIVANVSNVNTLMTEITTACDEQSKGVSEISAAVNELDQVTQQNAATSEQAANAAEDLSSQTVALKKVIELLVTTVKGANGETQHFEVSRANKPASRKVIPISAAKKLIKSAPAQKREVTPVSTTPSSNDSRFEEA